MYYLVLFTSFFLIALVIKRNRTVFYALAEDSFSLVNELLSDISEEQKIKHIQKSTNRLVISLFKTLVVGVVAFAAGSVPVIIYFFLSQTDFERLDFSSFYSLLVISMGATVPFIIPSSNKNKTGYSELSRLLHRMALNNYFIGYKLFRQETKKLKRKKLKRRQDFVIITGLARAGTTSLMNDLSLITDFVSLSYANMPFLMCPNMWARFYKPKNRKLKERSHQDGIMIGLNSNEALEEYFFKVMANDEYIHENRLLEYAISPEHYNDYLDYQSIIKLDNNKIYLAKNNNFILRYKSLRGYNDDFIMVVLFRDPLTHAESLKEKHLYYKDIQQEDPFILEYMDWLGHHEFGKHQKSFSFHSSTFDIQGDKASLDFWLKIWINYYSYVLSFDHPNTIFVNYHYYCQKPKATVESIMNKMGITSELPDYRPFHNKRSNKEKFSNDLYERAQIIYEELCHK